jgi:hypothetical protein
LHSGRISLGIIIIIMALRALMLGLMALSANGMELTPENWDEKTAGKTVFIKFLAPW